MPYHHGDLRRAILTAAVDAITAVGSANMSLRDVARRAGVSHAAPVHHFGDKAGVLTVLRVIKAAQRLEFTLDEVAELLEPHTGLADRATAKLAEVEARIADLSTVPGDPEAIARAAVCLASDDAAFVHGITLDVDGGRQHVAVLAG